VIRETVYDNAVWYEVEAVVKHPDYVGPGMSRDLYLKAANLKSARRS
jgi:hypothetical protein